MHLSIKPTFLLRIEASGKFVRWIADVNCSPLDVSNSRIKGFSFYPLFTSNKFRLKSFENIECVFLFSIFEQRVVTAHINSTTSQIKFSLITTLSNFKKLTLEEKIGIFKMLK